MRGCHEWKMRVLLKNKTWDLAIKPKGVDPASCEWAYKLKRKADSHTERYKARHVAWGSLKDMMKIMKKLWWRWLRFELSFLWRHIIVSLMLISVDIWMVEDLLRVMSSLLIRQVFLGLAWNKIRCLFLLLKQGTRPSLLPLKNMFGWGDLSRIFKFPMYKPTIIQGTIKILSSLWQIWYIMLELSILNIKHQFIRKKMLDGSINVMKMRSKDNITDIFTKSLFKCLFELFQAKLGLVLKIHFKRECWKC